MRKLLRASASLLLVLAVFGSGPVTATAGHNEDDHTDNIKLLTEHGILQQRDDPETPENEEVRAQGSDLAFEGDLMVAGSYQGVGLFKLLPKAPYLRQLSFLQCPGSQGDVSVWGDLVFVSVDAPRTNNRCDSPAAANQVDTATRHDWEGLRIIDISNVRRPRQIAAVRTPCGSHTHTLMPKGRKLYAYIESYPLTSGLSQDCNAASHRQVPIVEIPLDAPEDARLIQPFIIGSAIGCHDVTVFPSRKIAIAACISESQVWDITVPRNPTILATIRNPEIQIHHSSAFTWDGKIAVLGDEFGGAAAGGCVGNSEVPMGAMWFYDISDPSNPTEVGYYAPPRVHEIPDSAEEAQRPRCTTHIFNIPPLKKPGKYIAVSSYYSVALSVVDFSDPANPEEIGYYLPRESGTNPDSWSSYWYNGFIYTNDHASLAGIRVYRMDELTLKDVKPYKVRLNPQTQIL